MSDSEIIENFLNEYSKEMTRKTYKRHLIKFLEWTKTSPSELVKEYKESKDKLAWKKKLGAVVVAYNNYLLKSGGNG